MQAPELCGNPLRSHAFPLCPCRAGTGIVGVVNVTVEFGGGAKFVVTAGTHAMICDLPAADGGLDDGMSPPELLLASLGTCAGYYASRYLRTRDLPCGVKVNVSAEKLHGPERLGDFCINVSVDRPLDERHRLGISRAVHTCLIHNTFSCPSKIDVAITAR